MNIDDFRSLVLTSEVAKTFCLFSLRPAFKPYLVHSVPTQAIPMTPKEVCKENDLRPKENIEGYKHLLGYIPPKLVSLQRKT